MSSSGERRNLVILVADRNMNAAITGILSRPKSLRLPRITFRLLVHPQDDSGVFRRAQEFLRPFTGKYDRSLAVFDREGCGRDALPCETLERDVEQRLAQNGWANRCAAVVLDPELESWVWSDSPEVDRVLGWVGHSQPLRNWLAEKGFAHYANGKFIRPKEALEAALRHVRKPRSSAVYRQLAERLSLDRCTDPAFLKLKATLQRWFPPVDDSER